MLLLQHARSNKFLLLLLMLLMRWQQHVQVSVFTPT